MHVHFSSEQVQDLQAWISPQLPLNHAHFCRCYVMFQTLVYMSAVGVWGFENGGCVQTQPQARDTGIHRTIEGTSCACQPWSTWRSVSGIHSIK